MLIKSFAAAVVFSALVSGCDNIPLEKLNEHVVISKNEWKSFTWEYTAGTFVEVSFEHFSGGPADVCVMGVKNYKKYREKQDYSCVDKVSAFNTTSAFNSGWHKWDSYSGTLFIIVRPTNWRKGVEGRIKFQIKV
ncbi:MAG: hypothetical protein ACI92N_002064 [Pseudomonadales bacterium]|jgi:hypothetical protein